MLWFCNSSESLETKILQAAAYYEAKYGAKPDTALVSLKEINTPTIPGITVKASKSIMKNHILIGRSS